MSDWSLHSLLKFIIYTFKKNVINILPKLPTSLVIASTLRPFHSLSPIGRIEHEHLGLATRKMEVQFSSTGPHHSSWTTFNCPSQLTHRRLVKIIYVLFHTILHCHMDTWFHYPTTVTIFFTAGIRTRDLLILGDGSLQ